MLSKKVGNSIIKSLPVAGALAIGVGATLAVLNRNKLENKIFNRLTARQIIRQSIPLQ